MLECAYNFNAITTRSSFNAAAVHVTHFKYLLSRATDMTGGVDWVIGYLFYAYKTNTKLILNLICNFAANCIGWQALIGI